MPSEDLVSCPKHSLGYPEFVASFGSTTPNYQGIFLRGYGNQSYVQNNGLIIGDTNTIHMSGKLGQIQGDSIRNITGYFWTDSNAANNFGVVWGPSEVFCATKNTASVSGYSHAKRTNNQGISFDISRMAPTSHEIRPVNKAVKYLIRITN